MSAALFAALPTFADGFFDDLFGLTRLSLFHENTSLGWRHPLEAWHWGLIIVGAVALAAWSYSRLVGPLGARIALATLRALLIIFVAALLAGPELREERSIPEQDWLLVLVDRSASLQIRDVIDDNTLVAGGQPMSRDEALRRALAQHPDLFGPEKLGKDRRIVWLAFDATTREMDPPTTAKDDSDTDDTNGQPPKQATLPDADGRATALRSAIEQALQRAVGRRVSGIVLFTDGRSPQATGADLVAQLKRQGVGVFPVPLGSAQTPMNLAVGRIDAPERAFINDIVPVTVTVEAIPQNADVDLVKLKVRLVDKQTGKTLDERPVTGGLDKPVRLSTESAIAGRQSWRVEVVYDTPPDASLTQRELITDDNYEDVTIDLVDRPIRVLFVEGYPRWEYRFLKTMLVREKSIDSSIMLVSADATFAQEGNSPISRLPATASEFEPYDVIIIGDVPANYFSADQLNLLHDHVSARGAGVIWVGGEHAMPRSYSTTTLANLLPMTQPAAVDRLDPALGPIQMRPQALARQLNVLRLRSQPDEPGAPSPDDSPDASAWPGSLPPLLWAQDIGKLKPAAEPLAVSQRFGENAYPMIVRMRYGGGQSIYIATDETWRWRFGRGELYPQQFWIQLIRMLGRARLEQRDERVYLQVSDRRAQLDQTVNVKLTVRDPLILQRNLPRIRVAVTRADDPAGRVLDRIDLAPSEQWNAPQRAAAVGRVYEALWRTSADGELLLKVIEPGLDDLNIAEPMEVFHPDDERRQPATDHPRLEALAKATDTGRVVALNELDKLPALIPKLNEATPDDEHEPLWNSPLSLLIVILLITAEWIGRKLIRLV